MPAARPNGVALTSSIASSSVVNGMIDTTGAKISSHIDAHRRLDVRQDRRVQQRAVAAAAVTSVAPAATASRTQPPRGAASRSLIIGPTSVAGSCGSPTCSARADSHEPLGERLDDVALHEQPLRRGAHLPRAAERRRRAARRGAIQIRVLADDRRRDAAELERHRPQPDALAQPPADRRAAGKGVEVDVVVLDQPRPEIRRRDRESS